MSTAGGVGVVFESPPDNRQPYLVHFADGETVAAFFDELALRRLPEQLKMSPFTGRGLALLSAQNAIALVQA